MESEFSPDTTSCGVEPTRADRASRTRSALLSAAQDAFALTGYSGTSLRKIAATANVDVALVKRYFGDKQGLFFAALNDMVDSEISLPPNKPGFGGRTLALLLGGGDRLLKTLIFAASDPQVGDRATEILTSRVMIPLAEWIGGEKRHEKSVKVLTFCTGFLVRNMLVPIIDNEQDWAGEWLSEEIQRIVDE